jgi:hypothetical protein
MRRRLVIRALPVAFAVLCGFAATPGLLAAICDDLQSMRAVLARAEQELTLQTQEALAAEQREIAALDALTGFNQTPEYVAAKTAADAAGAEERAAFDRRSQGRERLSALQSDVVSQRRQAAQVSAELRLAQEAQSGVAPAASPPAPAAASAAGGTQATRDAAAARLRQLRDERSVLQAWLRTVAGASFLEGLGPDNLGGLDRLSETVTTVERQLSVSEGVAVVGDQRSVFYERLVDLQQALHDYTGGGSGASEAKEDVDRLRGELRAACDNAKPRVARLRQLVEFDEPSAEFEAQQAERQAAAAATSSPPAQPAASGRIRELLDRKAAEDTKLASLSAALAEQERLVQALDAEHVAAETRSRQASQSWAALQAREPQLGNALNAAGQAADAARERRREAQVKRDEWAARVSRAEADLEAVRAEIRTRVAAGREAGRQAAASSRGPDQGRCLAELRTARTELQIAARLMRENAACFGRSDTAAQIDQWLRATESVTCGGRGLDPSDDLLDVPDVRGLRYPQAAQIIRDAKFRVASALEIRAPRGPADAEIVTDQRPLGRAQPGETVTLVHHESLRAVPPVIASRLQVAADTLARANMVGFPVPHPTADPAADQIVFRQSPLPLEQAFPGTSVTLDYWIYSAPQTATPTPPLDPGSTQTVPPPLIQPPTVRGASDSATAAPPSSTAPESGAARSPAAPEPPHPAGVPDASEPAPAAPPINPLNEAARTGTWTSNSESIDPPPVRPTPGGEGDLLGQAPARDDSNDVVAGAAATAAGAADTRERNRGQPNIGEVMRDSLLAGAAAASAAQQASSGGTSGTAGGTVAGSGTGGTAAPNTSGGGAARRCSIITFSPPAAEVAGIVNPNARPTGAVGHYLLVEQKPQLTEYLVVSVPGLNSCQLDACARRWASARMPRASFVGGAHGSQAAAASAARQQCPSPVTNIRLH